MLALLTFIVSAAIIVAGVGEEAAMRAGMIPATIGTPLASGLLPWFVTPLSATLVHGGWLHLSFNLVILVYVGRQLERALGAGGLVGLYVVGAYAAALGNWLPDPRSLEPSIGASGAVSALVGGYALLYGQPRGRAVGPIPARAVHVLWLAAAWVAIQLLVGIAGGGALTGDPTQRIAIGAHIGGFLGGLLLSRPLLLWRYRRA